MVPTDRSVEISLTEEEASALRTLLAKLMRTPDSDRDATGRLPELARRLQTLLDERRRFLPDQLVGEPACDMLLILFCAEARGERLSITRLGYLVGLPQATAARWIASLARAGLVQQRQDRRDRRRRFLGLSDSARRDLSLWLEHVDEMLEPSLSGPRQEPA